MALLIRIAGVTDLSAMLRSDLDWLEAGVSVCRTGVASLHILHTTMKRKGKALRPADGHQPSGSLPSPAAALGAIPYHRRSAETQYSISKAFLMMMYRSGNATGNVTVLGDRHHETNSDPSAATTARAATGDAVA